MSYRVTRETNSNYNLWTECYTNVSGFSSIWFKFNVDYLEKYN
jgi:hypothetical protein